MAMAWHKYGTLPSDYEKQNTDKMKNIMEIIDTMNSRKNQVKVTQSKVASMMRGL